MNYPNQNTLSDCFKNDIISALQEFEKQNKALNNPSWSDKDKLFQDISTELADKIASQAIKEMREANQ